MIDKRSRIGKMIDYKKVVYQCLRCGRQFVGDANTELHHCPICSHKAQQAKPQLVIVENLVVRK